MIMAKHWCERCGVVIARNTKNNVVAFQVDEAAQSWLVEAVIISLGWFCDDCRQFILKAALAQNPIET